MNLYSVSTTKGDIKPGYSHPAPPDTLIVASSISVAAAEAQRLFPSREIVGIERKYTNVVVGE